MSTTGIVASRIGLVFVLLGVGWALRRRGILDGRSVGQLSRLVVDVAFPALVVVELIRTLEPETIASDAISVLLGALVVVSGLGVGWLVSSRTAAGPTRRTIAFVVGVPNWIFLPLLIAEAAYGPEGVKAVLLMNAGALAVLWTLGVTVLRGRGEGGGAARALLTNPGLVATALGATLALLAPGLRHWIEAPLTELGGAEVVGATLLGALKLFGSVTVPLALLVTGAQLGGLTGSQLRPDVRVALVAAGRLIIAPVLMWGILVGLGDAVAPVPSEVALLVAAMPVAISASLFAERFDGDVPTAAPAVFWTTLLSLGTVPLLVALTG